MIQRVSTSSLQTATACFEVENTPRGGHFIRVQSLDGTWAGLYRYGALLILLARCGGTPPATVGISAEVREVLWHMLQKSAG